MNKVYGGIVIVLYLIASSMEYEDELRGAEYCSEKQVQQNGLLEGQEIDALDRKICPSLGGSSVHTFEQRDEGTDSPSLISKNW